MGSQRVRHGRETFTFTGHLGIQVFLIPEVPCLPWISPDIPWEWASSGKSGWSSSASGLILQFSEFPTLYQHSAHSNPSFPCPSIRTRANSPHTLEATYSTLQAPSVASFKKRERKREERKKQKQRAKLSSLTQKIEGLPSWTPWITPAEQEIWGTPGMMDLEANFILVTDTLSDFTNSTWAST